MSRQGIFTGFSPNDGTGDSLASGAVKINANFQEIYNTFGDGNTLISYVNSSGVSTTSNYANISGVSTLSQGLTGTPNVTVGVITASSFSGSGANLTNLPAGQLTGSLPAIDGSALTGIVASGSGVVIRDEGNPVGTAGTINFSGPNVTASLANGISTVTVSDAYAQVSGISTLSQGLTGTPNITVNQAEVSSTLSVTGITSFKNNVHIENNNSLLIGDLDELQLFHSGPDSYIENTSSGNLIIRDAGIGIQLRRSGGGPNAGLMAAFNNDAGVELYYDSVLKLQTFQNGVAINDSIGIGTTAGDPPYRLTVSGIGATITQGLLNAIADLTSSVDGYGQVNIRNSLSAPNASGDLVITADTGTDISNYVDFGINNTGFSTSSWTINGPLDGYLYSSDSNLSIGVAAANKYLSFFVGDTLIENEQVRVTETGVGIGSTIPTSKLTVEGDVNVSGVVTATSFTGSGANLTSLPAGQLTGALPAIDGSALTGVTATGSGVEIRDSGTAVGTASTIDFGANLSVSPVSAGVVTVTASGGGGESYWVSTASGIHTLSNVGIGSTIPTSALTVQGDVSVSGVSTFNDDLRVSNVDSNLRLGLKSNQFSNQLELRHSDSGGSSHIYHTGSGTFHFSMEQSIGDKIQFDTISEVLCRMYRDGPVELYYDNVKTFETTSTGAVVTGILTATSFVGGGIPVTGIGTFDAIVGVSTVIDSFDIATENISIIEYNIFVNNGSNKIQSQKALIMLGDEAYSQEYAIMYSNNHLVSVGATISAGICNVTLTPSSGVSGLTTFKFSKGGSV